MTILTFICIMPSKSCCYLKNTKLDENEFEINTKIFLTYKELVSLFFFPLYLCYWTLFTPNTCQLTSFRCNRVYYSMQIFGQTRLDQSFLPLSINPDSMSMYFSLFFVFTFQTPYFSIVTETWCLGLRCMDHFYACVHIYNSCKNK